jgi:hypothetical protein
MTTLQLPLTGLQLKEQGIESLERFRWVDDARLAAETMLLELIEFPNPFPETLTSDDLHLVMGTPPHDNCYGAIFHDKRFRATGERVRSTRPEAHGRWIEVWRLA